MYPGQVKYSEFSRPSNPQGNITLKGGISSCRKTLPIDEMVILYDLQRNHWKLSNYKMKVVFPCFSPTYTLPPNIKCVGHWLLHSKKIKTWLKYIANVCAIKERGEYFKSIATETGPVEYLCTTASETQTKLWDKVLTQAVGEYPRPATAAPRNLLGGSTETETPGRGLSTL